jgi:hypothetical protein
VGVAVDMNDPTKKRREHWTNENEKKKKKNGYELESVSSAPSSPPSFFFILEESPIVFLVNTTRCCIQFFFHPHPRNDPTTLLHLLTLVPPCIQHTQRGADSNLGLDTFSPPRENAPCPLPLSYYTCCTVIYRDQICRTFCPRSV